MTTRVVPIVRLTPHKPMPAALPRTMSQLKALTILQVGYNKLPLTDVDFIIESFPQLTSLGLEGLGLTGEHLCSTNRASYPADTVACSVARLDWAASGP